jgi:hypothetical protein
MPSPEGAAMKRSLVACLLAVPCFARSSATSAQIPASPSPVPLPLHFVVTESLLAGLPRRTVAVSEEAGKTDSYSGVDLGVVLAKNGAPLGDALRGHALADYVLVRASDGYQAVFALHELDATFTGKIVLLADERNGAPIGSDVGPFRILVPDEKQRARWVRNVTELDVMSAP